MSILYPSCADVTAEREAEALAFFAEHLDQPEPLTRLQRERDFREAAAARGIEQAPSPRYPRKAVVRRWLAVCDAVAVGRPLQPTRCHYGPTTRAERAKRQERYRQHRAGYLQPAPGETMVPIPRAAELVGLTRSGLEKAMGRGDVPRRKCAGRTVVPVDGLLAYSLRRLSVA